MGVDPRAGDGRGGAAAGSPERFRTGRSAVQKALTTVVGIVFPLIGVSTAVAFGAVGTLVGGDVGGSSSALFLVVPLVVGAMFVLVPLGALVGVWRAAVWVDGDDVLHQRPGLGGTRTVDLRRLFEVRYFTQQRTSRRNGRSRTTYVPMVQVRDTAGGDVTLSVRGWAEGDALLAGIDASARAVHAAIIDEGGSRREGAGIPQDRADPWSGAGAGAGIGYGEDHRQR